MNSNSKAKTTKVEMLTIERKLEGHLDKIYKMEQDLHVNPE